jgi:hypothetical protein
MESLFSLHTHTHIICTVHCTGYTQKGGKTREFSFLSHYIVFSQLYVCVGVCVADNVGDKAKQTTNRRNKHNFCNQNNNTAYYIYKRKKGDFE